MVSTIVKFLLVAPFRYGVPLLGRGAAWLLRHPRTSLTSAAVSSAVILLGWDVLVWSVAIAYLAGRTWIRLDDDSFDRLAVTWMRRWWRRWVIYRRTWAHVAERCGLAVEDRRTGSLIVPRITRLELSDYWDTVTIRLETGQDIATYRAVSEALRHAYRVERVTVREVYPGQVALEIMRRDPLLQLVPASAMPATTSEIDWTAVPVGLTEHLQPMTISLVGGHTLGAGSSGAGKAGIVWNALRAVAPAIADGTVQLHFIDPKGMELRQARAIATDYVTREEETLDLFDRLVEAMQQDQEEMGDRGERDHVPSPEQPLHLVVIDELAPLTAYWRRSIRDKIEDRMGLLLTQGRAVGYILLALIQEPTKDINPQRDLYGRRIGLRLPTEDYIKAALGDDALDLGAACHRIPESVPGINYQVLSGAKAVTRNRLGYVSNQDIRELVEYVQALRNVARLDERRTSKKAA